MGEAQKLSGPSQTPQKPQKLDEQQFAQPKNGNGTKNKNYFGINCENEALNAIYHIINFIQ